MQIRWQSFVADYLQSRQRLKERPLDGSTP